MMKYCPECGHMLVLKLLEAEQKKFLIAEIANRIGLNRLIPPSVWWF